MPMPSFPVSLLIEKQIKPVTEGKTIAEIQYKMCHKGDKNWISEDVLKKLTKIKAEKIIYADSNYMITEGHRIGFGYHTGDLRYFDNAADVDVNTTVNSRFNGYLVTFIFADASRVTLLLYDWATSLSVDESGPGKKKTGVIPKSPIEVTDDGAFTLEAFKKWLKEREGTIISVNCSTSKGAFDVYNSTMSYIFLISNIHPKSKTKNLTDEEIERLYRNIKELVNDYRNGTRVYGFNDIYGEYQSSKNNIVKMDSGMLGKPCPICGAPVEGVACGGTKMYFCPECQVVK